MFFNLGNIIKRTLKCGVQQRKNFALKNKAKKGLGQNLKDSDSSLETANIKEKMKLFKLFKLFINIALISTIISQI